MEANTDYVIAGGKEGKERLNVLSEVLNPYTKELLLRCGLTKGNSFLDNGCGGGNVTNMVAEIVGPDGTVTGTDIDAAIIELAKKDSANKRISNTTFLNINTYELPFHKEFDIAYSRFLLSHLNHPIEAILKMKEAVKLGGKLIVEDVQFSGHFSYPENEAFNKYVQLYTQVILQKGANANIGPQLPELFAAAGLVSISFDVIQPTFQSGHGKWMGYITLEKIKTALIAARLTTESEITKLLLELDAFTKDAATIISLPRIFRVVGTVQ